MGDMLQNFPTEEVEIYDKDGNKVIKARGLFGKTGLTVTDTSVPIIEGYIVERMLPNGSIEKYEIIESKYVKGHGSICDFYKLILLKNNTKSLEEHNYTYNNYSINIGNNNKIDKSILGNDNKV